MFTFALGVDSVTCQRDWAVSDRDLYLRLAEAAIEMNRLAQADLSEVDFIASSGFMILISSPEVSCPGK